MYLVVEIGGTIVLKGWKFDPIQVDNPDKNHVVEQPDGIQNILEHLPQNLRRAHLGVVFVLDPPYDEDQLRKSTELWFQNQNITVEQIVVINKEQALRESWVAGDRRSRHLAHVWMILVDYDATTIVPVKQGRIVTEQKIVLTNMGTGEILQRLGADKHITNSPGGYLHELLNDLYEGLTRGWNFLTGGEVTHPFLEVAPEFVKDLLTAIQREDPFFGIRGSKLLIGGFGGGLINKLIQEQLPETEVWPDTHTPYVLLQGADKYGEKILGKKQKTVSAKRENRLSFSTKNQRILAEISKLNRKERGRFVEDAILFYLKNNPKSKAVGNK
jgi:hypothetical protein